MDYRPAKSNRTIPGRANALEQGPVLRAKHGLTDGVPRRSPDPAFTPTRHWTKCREKNSAEFFLDFLLGAL